MLRINEAIERAKRKGIKINKLKLSEAIWQDQPEALRRVKMSNLCTGKTARIEPEWVNKICDALQVTPNYLFGYKED